MQYAVRRERNDNSKITNDNSNSMYLFTFHNSKVLSDREHMSQPIIVTQMKYANSVPVPAEVEKLNQKFHATSNEKAFNKGELMRYARNSSTSLSIN